MIDDNEIWRMLTGEYPVLKKKIKSYWRADNSPGCSFAEWNGKVRFYDACDKLRHGKTAIQMYMIQNNMSFDEAIKDIKSKYGNPCTKKEFLPKQEVTKTEIIPTKMKWNETGKEYWSKLGVIDLSSMFQVKSLKYIKEEGITERDVSKELCFTYIFDNGQIKIYSPYAKKQYKFLGSVQAWNCWWKNEDKYDTLLTLKASKCYKVIESIVNEYNIPITLNHWQSESFPSPYTKDGIITSSSRHLALNKVPNLTKIKTYKRHIVIYDNDTQGVKAADYCKELLGSETYFTPFEKDITDFLLTQGREAVITWLFSILGLPITKIKETATF